MRGRKELDELRRALKHAQDPKFGPRDSLGWPLMIDEVMHMTDMQAVHASPLHCELRHVVNVLNASNAIHRWTSDAGPDRSRHTPGRASTPRGASRLESRLE